MKKSLITLARITVGYALLNFLMLFLCIGGIIHPPWAVLAFFTFMGPAIIVLTLIILRMTTPSKYKLPEILIFTVLITFLAFLNLALMHQASAAV